MPAKKKASEKPAASRNGKGSAARAKAVTRLIESYPEAFANLLREEREKVGLAADTRTPSRISQFARWMVEQGVDQNEVQQALDKLGFKAKL